ncbi:MAG: AbrB/MazE/SpoVT family DNA-binding domain-containing protein [Chloroflexi bacterium]|nr:AbrB/MazE/SpoVT family DNA-binding domain-containing protein [Chloroflexota bacterium]
MTKIDKNGRVFIPAEYRKELGLNPGDAVVIKLLDGELQIVSHAEALRRVRELIARYVPADRSLADELIAERRAEAARE